MAGRAPIGTPTDPVDPRSQLDVSIMGRTGLKMFAGRVYEEFDPNLTQEAWRRICREMTDNDSVVGSTLYVIEMLLRGVEWRYDPADPSNAAQLVADNFQSMLYDMDTTWQDTLTDILGMIPWGWSFLETNFKTRNGDAMDPTQHSQFNDGWIGWRSLAIRSQDSLLRWESDAEGNIVGMWQLAPPTYIPTLIPSAKALHFRTRPRKQNPEGFALAPDTPIPTPDGWRTMDELEPGAKVFDEMGRIRYVTAVADWENRPAYRMTFSDGSSIVADAKHEWPTSKLWERSQRLDPKARSTAEIAQTVHDSNGVSNHAIAWGGALDYPRQSLAVDPYFLGLWLGDGTSATADVSCEVHDAEEELALVMACGYSGRVDANGTSDNGRLIRVRGKGNGDSDGPTHRLRAIGVLNNKHIPAAYLRGDISQRLALLSGLMDSDGTVDASGRCEFTNVNRGLVDGVAELVRSLGIGCVPRLRKRAISGVRHEAWCAKFTPDFAPFRLSRKLAHCKLARARKYHYIVRVEPVANQRTRCIEVDSPSHLFLAGASMVPTHNSVLRNAYRPWYFKKRIENLLGIGIERDLAGLPIAFVPPEIMDPSAPDDQKALFETIKRLVTNVRRDEQEGLVFPMAYDDEGKPLYDFKLLTTGGTRQFDMLGVLQYFDQRIAGAALADFLLLGHEQVGSFALATSKTGTFDASVSAILDSICEEINEHGVPNLMRLNGIPQELTPKLTHGDVQSVDLAEIGTYLQALGMAGVPVGGDRDLQEYLFKIAHFPVPQDIQDAEATLGTGFAPEESAFPTSALPTQPTAPQGGAPMPGVEGPEDDDDDGNQNPPSDINRVSYNSPGGAPYVKQPPGDGSGF